MTPDEQEAGSKRYGSEPFFVLPLTSGNIAVISRFRDLLGIATTWEEAKAIGATQPDSWFDKDRELLKATKEVLDLDINLDDLDLGGLDL